MTRRTRQQKNCVTMLQVARPCQRGDEFPERLLADLFDERYLARRHQRFIVGYRGEECIFQSARRGADFSDGTRGESGEPSPRGFVSERLARRVLAALGERIEHGGLHVWLRGGNEVERAGEF